MYKDVRYSRNSLSLLSRLIIPHITSKHKDFTVATVCKRYAFETENGTRTAAKKYGTYYNPKFID